MCLWYFKIFSFFKKEGFFLLHTWTSIGPRKNILIVWVGKLFLHHLAELMFVWFKNPVLIPLFLQSDAISRFICQSHALPQKFWETIFLFDSWFKLSSFLYDRKMQADRNLRNKFSWVCWFWSHYGIKRSVNVVKI